MLLINILSLIFIYHIFINISKTQLSIKDNIVLFQVYRSFICFIISICSSYICYYNWDNLDINPIYYTNKQIKNTNIFALSFFCSDLINMIIHNNKRVSLWIHHLICILVFYTHCVYFNNSSIIFTWLLLAEYMSLASGVDALAKYYNKRKILFWTKLYRCLIILLVRFPIWLKLMSLGLRNETIYPSGKLSCILGSLCMIILDIYWFRLCLRFFKKSFS